MPAPLYGSGSRDGHAHTDTLAADTPVNSGSHSHAARGAGTAHARRRAVQRLGREPRRHTRDRAGQPSDPRIQGRGLRRRPAGVRHLRRDRSSLARQRRARGGGERPNQHAVLRRTGRARGRADQHRLQTPIADVRSSGRAARRQRRDRQSLRGSERPAVRGRTSCPADHRRLRERRQRYRFS